MSKSLICGLALAALPVAFAHAGDALAGKEKATVCAACHGAEGNSLSPEFPRLAGQHEDYLLRALLDYKLGNRKNPIMQAQVANLAKQDMADLAAWFSQQEGLETRR